MRQNAINFDLQLDLERIVEPATRKRIDEVDRFILRNHKELFSQCDSHHIGFLINALCTCGLWPIATAVRSQSIRDVCKKLETCDFNYLVRRPFIEIAVGIAI